MQYALLAGRVSGCLFTDIFLEAPMLMAATVPCVCVCMINVSVCIGSGPLKGRRKKASSCISLQLLSFAFPCFFRSANSKIEPGKISSTHQASKLPVCVAHHSRFPVFAVWVKRGAAWSAKAKIACTSKDDYNDESNDLQTTESKALRGNNV